MERVIYGEEISAQVIKNVSKHIINAVRKALSKKTGFFLPVIEAFIFLFRVRQKIHIVSSDFFQSTTG